MIGVTRDGHVTTLEMQRPERRNALNSELVDGLREAVEKAAAEDVRAIVLTGQGTVFCAGADLTERRVRRGLPEKAIALNLAIDSAPMPVIGAINGPAIGAGVQLAMICDLRVVAPDAFFQFPRREIRPGAGQLEHPTADVAGRIRPGPGDAVRPRRSSPQMSRCRPGWPTASAALADAQAWAAEIAGLAPLALQHAKRVLNDDGAYEDPWPRAQGAVRQGVGQPGRHRGPGGAHREAATELSGSLTDAGRGAAVRLRDGHRCWAAAGCCAHCRALRRRVGARPGEIRAVAQRSPNYHDGVFVNVDPASPINLDREQQRLLIRELVGSRSEDGRANPSRWPRRRRPTPHRRAWRPAGTATPPRWSRSTATGCSPTRCGADAVRRRGSSARSGCTRCRCRWRRCLRWMRC